MTEVKVFPFNVIHYSACGSNEYIHTSAELVCLIVNRYTTVDSQDVVFIIWMLQSIELFCNLQGQLSSRGKHDALNLTVS